VNVNVPKGLRPLVRGFYQQQKLRIQTGNRLVNHFLVKLGVQPGEAPPDEVRKMWYMLKEEHSRLTDALASRAKKWPRNTLFPYDGLITEYAEFAFVNQYFTELAAENQLNRQIKEVVEAHPLWRYWLVDVKGVGPIMTGVLLSEIDFNKARYPSSLWKYAGLDVKKGKGRSRRKEHLEVREYTDKNGEVKEKLSLSYNPFLKSKLMGVLSVSFLRLNSPYREIYDNYRNRLDNHVKYKEVSKGRKNLMARRYMIKIFLKDLFIVFCRLSGRGEPVPYEQAKLGMKPIHPTPYVAMKDIGDDDVS